MNHLIEALTIFAKYKNAKRPTHCEHDVLYIMDVARDEVSVEDRARLEVLHFFYSDRESCWMSFHFGSA